MCWIPEGEPLKMLQVHSLCSYLLSGTLWTLVALISSHTQLSQLRESVDSPGFHSMLCTLKPLFRQWLWQSLFIVCFFFWRITALHIAWDTMISQPLFYIFSLLFLVCTSGKLKLVYTILDRNRSWWPVWLKDSPVTFQTLQRTVMQSMMLPASLYFFSFLSWSSHQNCVL